MGSDFTAAESKNKLPAMLTTKSKVGPRRVKPAVAFKQEAQQTSSNPAITKAYVPTRLTSKDYPDLVPADQPVDTVAVGAVLVAANFPQNSVRYHNIANFVDAFFTEFQTLLEPGHNPKWREVNLAADLPGWTRFPAADEWLKRNATASTVNNDQMKEIFARFLDERSQITGGKAMSQQQINELFSQFQQWQASQQQK